MTEEQHAFIAVAVGDEKSDARQRANEMLEHVILPVLEPKTLKYYRADQDATPGVITTQILKQLISARVVIADVTNRNANVYYELAIAHSYGKPVILMADTTDDLAFDIQGLRSVIVGEWTGNISAADARDAQRDLGKALDAVLQPDFEVDSIVKQAIDDAQRVEAIQSESPQVAEELVALRGIMEEVRTAMCQTRHAHQTAPDSTAHAHTADQVAVTPAVTVGNPQDLERAKEALKEIYDIGLVPPLNTYKSDHTSRQWNEWVDALHATFERRRGSHDPTDQPLVDLVSNWDEAAGIKSSPSE